MAQRQARAPHPETAEEMRLFPLLRSLGDAELDFIRERAFVDTFAKGETRHAKPGFGPHLYLLWRGRLRITSAAPGGAHVTLLSATPGDHFGELSLFAAPPPSHFDMLADLPSAVLRVAAGDVRDLMARNEALTAALLKGLAQRAVVLQDRLFEVVTLSARGRLLADMLRLAGRGRRVGAAAIVVSPPTHDALATHVGLTREAVSRHLKALREQGLLAGDRSQIIVPDVARLRDAVHAEAGARASYEIDG